MSHVLPTWSLGLVGARLIRMSAHVSAHGGAGGSLCVDHAFTVPGRRAHKEALKEVHVLLPEE